jgi:CheY-like chemotaxis protein
MKSAPLSTTTPRILLVDDNRDGLVVRRLLLEEAGCQVETAGGPEEALKLFDRATFDVVVTDYRMPQMNGTELITRIRALKPEVRIILLSGWVEQLGFNEQNTGADAVIAKNAREAAQLVRSVRRLMNGAPRKKPIGRQAGSPGSTPRNLAH